MDKTIKSDGKTYNFVPGKNGSLTTEAKPNLIPVDYNRPPAKVVPILKEMRKRKADALVAAVRG